MPFPHLFDFRIFAPTLLRLAIAAMFLYAGYRHWKAREATAQLSFPLVGRGEWVAWLAVLFHFVAGLMLFLGYYTQIAALLGTLGAIKGLLLGKRYPTVFLFSRSTYFLILVICASLMLTGAGIFAFDTPGL
ncbi:MAG TPA: DoxX family protein [Candidatus Paceibacterota bacterium]|nr:DoxX family protein [Candidatus Paceibacterota bacterium]